MFPAFSSRAMPPLAARRATGPHGNLLVTYAKVILAHPKFDLTTAITTRLRILQMVRDRWDADQTISTATPAIYEITNV